MAEPLDILITGGTGYIGQHLVPLLLERGHRVRVMARAESVKRVPAGAEPVIGDALSENSVAAALRPGDTLIHLVGTPHPSPSKAEQFENVDLVSIRASVNAARRSFQRRKAIIWLGATVLLGIIFLFCQGYEYFHAYNELNLTLNSGVYGSTFFLLTGFHGFHVFLGGTMLSVVLVRLIRGHFTADHHFAFEGAAWYWHFVDVVWLGLYVVVYWL